MCGATIKAAATYLPLARVQLFYQRTQSRDLCGFKHTLWLQD